MQGSIRSSDVQAFSAVLNAARNRVERFPIMLEMAHAFDDVLPRHLSLVRADKCVCKRVERVTIQKSLQRAGVVITDLRPSIGSGSAFLLTDAEAVAAIVWAACGGTDVAVTRSTKASAFGVVESGLVRLFAERVSAAVSEVMASEFPAIAFSVGAAQLAELNAALKGSTDEVLEIELALTLAGRPASLSLLLPADLFAHLRDVEPRGKKGNAKEASSADEAAAQLGELASGASVAIEAVLTRMTMSLSSIAELSVGDLVSLEVSLGDQASIECGGVCLATGQLGKRDGKLAIEIEVVGAGSAPVQGRHFEPNDEGTK